MNPKLLQLHPSIALNIFNYCSMQEAYSLFLTSKHMHKVGIYYFQSLYYESHICFNNPNVKDPSHYVRTLLSRKASIAEISNLDSPYPIEFPQISNIESILLLPHNIIVGLGLNGALYFYSHENDHLKLIEANENIGCKKIAGFNGLLTLINGMVIEYIIHDGRLEKKGKVDLPEKDDIISIAATGNLYYALGKSDMLYVWKDSYSKRIQLSNMASLSAELIKLYIIDNKSNIYTIDDTKVKENGELKIEDSKEMSHLNLTSLICGPMYTIGVCRKDIPEIKNWTTEELCERLAVGMFEKIKNTIKYSKITGKEIEAATESYISDTLGITLVNEKQKFINTVQKLKQETKIVTLYGVGNNTHGQLGNKNYINITNPIKIPLPELQEYEYIQSIFPCVQSLIAISSNHRAFVIGNCEKEENGIPEWKIITPDADASHNAYMHMATQKKRSLICVYHYEGKPQSKQFKPADKILQQIKWDTHLNANDFTIGYEDRFLGMLEVPYAQYTNAEIPFHRIHFIKKLGRVVWDRKLKTNFV